MNDFFFKKLDAYQVAKEFTTYIYQVVAEFPTFEQYALSSQIRRAAISVPSNIAEGVGRMAIKERLHFIEIAFASIFEVICQLDTALSANYITQAQYEKGEEIATRLTKILSGLRKSFVEKLANQD